MLIRSGISRHKRQSGTRFPYASGTKPAWPFAATSFYNIGLGANAAWSGPSGSDPVTANLISSTLGIPSNDSVIAQQLVWTNPVWTGASGDTIYTCSLPAYGPFAASGNFNMHVPSGANQTTDSDHIFCLFDQTNNIYAQWNNGQTIDTTGHTISGGLGGVWHTDGDGTPFAGQANAWPGIQGAELDQGFINHVLPVALDGSQLRGWDPTSTTFGTAHYNCVWPSVGSDWQGTPYTGTVTDGVPFGSIIGIPRSVVDVTTLGLTAGGLIIGKQLQDYGLIACNRTSGPHLYASWDAESTSAREATLQQIKTALVTLTPYLRVMKSWMTGQANLAHPTPGTLPAGYQYDPVYNSAAPVNGGGAYPRIAPIWDPTVPAPFN